MKRLVVCFDGTWNKPGETGKNTNVVKLFRAIHGEDRAGLDAGLDHPSPEVPTIKWYDTGVGTHAWERFRGGLMGLGLSLNVREGFKFLVDNYEPGDEIYLFGFSRGAYTARSLAGLIRNAGIVKKEHAPESEADDNPVISEAYELYRKRDESADTEEAKNFRTQYSWTPVPIKFIGVWDTVGALGVPLSIFESLNDARYRFHDTRLSSSVENAFHAIAVDEHREEYEATLWTPKDSFPNRLEQRWFIGAHSDVGGGSSKPQFSDIALRWMAEAAQLDGAGLELDASMIPASGTQHLSTSISDSFKAMLGGLYAAVKRLFGKRRFLRPVKATTHGKEVVDQTVHDKRQADKRYRPGNPGL